MKKIFTLIAAALLGLGGMQAQTVVVNKVGGEKITLQASEVESIEFNPAADTTEVGTFKGYITVASKYFESTYYGDSATITVLRAGDESLVRFHDGTWGTGLFSVTRDGQNISGSGTLSMPNPHGGGSARQYDATISGTMQKVDISVPAVMGGTTITWTYGDVPQQLKLKGTWTGRDSLNVGKAFPYNAEAAYDYTITTNDDNTINITFPQEVYPGTVMGDLTLSGYTIPNIAWNDSVGAFYKAFGDGTIAFHFTAYNPTTGTNTFDNDYTFDHADACFIEIRLQDDGKLYVRHDFQMGAMPFKIFGTLVATKKN